MNKKLFFSGCFFGLIISNVFLKIPIENIIIKGITLDIIMILFTVLVFSSFTEQNIYKKFLYTFLTYIGLYLFSNHIINVIIILINKNIGT